MPSGGTLTFTVDTATPAVNIVAPFPSNPSASTTPTFGFASEAGATSWCQLLPPNAAFGACASPTTYDAQLSGVHTFNVRATDAAGNFSAPAPSTWRIGAPATVTARTPPG